MIAFKWDSFNLHRTAYFCDNSANIVRNLCVDLNRDNGQIFPVRCILISSIGTLRYIDSRRCVLEGISANRCRCVRFTIYICQTIAIQESIITDACDTIWNCHRSYTIATFKSLIPNACDTIGNINRDQVGTIIKS